MEAQSALKQVILRHGGPKRFKTSDSEEGFVEGLGTQNIEFPMVECMFFVGTSGGQQKSDHACATKNIGSTPPFKGFDLIIVMVIVSFENAE